MMERLYPNYSLVQPFRLGDLIEFLESLEQDALIMGLGSPDSYRGYYDQLAFEPTDQMMVVGRLLADVKECVGRTFTGYKGGEYTMTERTSVWIARYGTTAGAGRICGYDHTTEKWLAVGDIW